MKKSIQKPLCRIMLCLTAALLLTMLVCPALAEDVLPAGAQDMLSSAKALSAAIAIGLAAGAGAIAMGISIGKSVDAISRQPEAEGSIRTNLMLGLVFVETAIIYALIVAILIIFVL